MCLAVCAAERMHVNLKICEQSADGLSTLAVPERQSMSLRRFLIALSICAASSTCAHANTLHSYCLSGTCLDNGTVTPTTSNPARFGFGEAHPVDSGLLWIVELAPNNSASAATLSGTHTTLSSVTGVQYGQSAWTTGKLDSYLKGQFSKFTPSSPISAYLPTTQSLDAAATGYDVYLFNFGSYNYGKATGDPQFRHATERSAFRSGSTKSRRHAERCGSSRTFFPCDTEHRYRRWNARSRRRRSPSHCSRVGNSPRRARENTEVRVAVSVSAIFLRERRTEV
jgi:hypothetical protein